MNDGLKLVHMARHELILKQVRAGLRIICSQTLPDPPKVIQIKHIPPTKTSSTTVWMHYRCNLPETSFMVLNTIYQVYQIIHIICTNSSKHCIKLTYLATKRGYQQSCKQLFLGQWEHDPKACFRSMGKRV